MKVAYLIDKESVGGGCEYIRRKIESRPNDECSFFYSEGKECTASKLAKWGADEVSINHLRAAVQLFNPFRNLGSVERKFLRTANIYFVAHGIHSRKYDYMRRSLVNILKRKLRIALERLIYNRCRKVVVETKSDEIKAHELYGQNINIVVENNSLDGWIAPHMEKMYDGERFRYVYIGRFNFQKGQDRWVRKMAEDGGEGRTLFIGDGKTVGECMALARKLGVYNRCSFVGEKERAEQYLKCADIVVSASRWEGMPFLIMKARALGCSILATDCPGNRDVLEGYNKWECLIL